jgi:hypothetical protein
MPLQRTLSLYRRTLKDTVYIRRYSGQGQSRTHDDYQARANVTGDGAAVLIGDIEQYEYTVIVLVEDLANAGLSMPVTNNDKLLFADKAKELAITFPDNATRSDDGTLVAYVIRCKG